MAEQGANPQRSHASPHATGEWTRPLACRPIGPEMPRKKPRPRISPEEPAYTTDEVARHLNVSRRSVQQWIKAGKLAAMRFGREYRIEAQDLESFKARAKQGKI
jgi:excisionase family DNA binding protein